MDCDGQQNASRFLADEIKEVGIEKALTDASVSPRSSISKTRYKNMDILISTSSMNSSSEIFKELSTDIQKSNLRKLNEYWKDEYDYILIDMPPALNYLIESIISTTDGVIVPVELGTFAIQGIAVVTDTINKVGASFTGCFISKYDKNNKTEHELKELLISSLGGKVFKTIIPQSYIIKNSQNFKLTAYEYMRWLTPAKRYVELTEEIIRKVD
ncbi:MAG TPA: ParA family protein [Ruminococcus sp.]